VVVLATRGGAVDGETGGEVIGGCRS